MMAASIMMATRAIRRRRVVPAALLTTAAGLGLMVSAPLAALASTPATPLPATGPLISGYRSAACVDDLGGSARNDTHAVMWACNGAPEQTWTIEADGTIQINGKCLDVYRDEKVNKAPVELWACTGHANQQWQPVNGTLVNPVSGKCLDDPRFNVTNGTQLEIYTCNGGRNQHWELP